jgi:hypothetical protein
MATYRERREARAERLREWAAKRDAKAEAEWLASKRMAEAIPMGQPILAGHYSQGRDTRYRQRISDTAGRAVANARKADEMQSKARHIEQALDASIYSDDPGAAAALERRIAGAEAERARITAFNKSARKAFRTGTQPDYSLLDDRQKAGLAAAAKAGQVREDGAFPAYATANIGGRIAKDRERLAQLAATNPPPAPAPPPPPPPAPAPKPKTAGAFTARRASPPIATAREVRASLAASAREVAGIHESALEAAQAGRGRLRAPPPLERRAARENLGSYRMAGNASAQGWDWFYGLSKAEQRRLREGWFTDTGGQSLDEIEERIPIRQWLDHTRRADAARALSTGRELNRDRYGGLNPNSLIAGTPYDAAEIHGPRAGRHIKDAAAAGRLGPHHAAGAHGVEFFTDKRGIVHPIRASYEHAHARQERPAAPAVTFSPSGRVVTAQTRQIPDEDF